MPGAAGQRRAQGFEHALPPLPAIGLAVGWHGAAKRLQCRKLGLQRVPPLRHRLFRSSPAGNVAGKPRQLHQTTAAFGLAERADFETQEIFGFDWAVANLN